MIIFMSITAKDIKFLTDEEKKATELAFPPDNPALRNE